MTNHQCIVCGCSFAGFIPPSGLCPDCDNKVGACNICGGPCDGPLAEAATADRICHDCQECAATVPTPEEIAMADRAAKRAVERTRERTELYQVVCRKILRQAPVPGCGIDLDFIGTVLTELLRYDASLKIVRALSWHCWFEDDDRHAWPQGVDRDLDTAILKAALHVVEEGRHADKLCALSA